MIVNTEKTYSCEYCDGRGFFVIEHYDSEENILLPNEIKECEHCDGAGLSSPIINAIKTYTSTPEHAKKS